MDAVLTRLKEDLTKVLGDNMLCLIHTGSRVRGEAVEESDYDVFLVLNSVNSSVLEKVRRLFLDYPDVSAYLASKQEFDTLPHARAQLLTLVHSEKLIGEIEPTLPTNDEVRRYITLMRRDWLERVRHYLIHPHTPERLVYAIHLALKYTCLYLSYRVFLETGRLPRTRKETAAYFRERKSQDLGVKLIEMHDNWHSHKEEAARKPESYLFLLEKFLRESRP